MSQYHHVVPWFNSEEWLNVYDKIYSPSASFIDKQEAHNLLLVWKARCPSLPSGIESTLTLLEVHIQDIRNSENVNDQLLRLAYSSAIMRFVNHMLDWEIAKGISLYQAAKSHGVPDWIIDLRHDTAHSNNLPSIELLREACAIALQWLQSNYWDKHKLCIKDFVSGQIEDNILNENIVTALMNFCICISICAYSKIRNLAEIPDPSMRESIINDARDLFRSQIDFSNLKTVSITSLINIVTANAKRLLKGKDTVSTMNKALLTDESIFLSLELVNFMGNNKLSSKHGLNRHYVQCFEVLLTFLQKNDLLLEFILGLIKITQCNNIDSQKSLLAALWVSEILKALRKSKQLFDKIKGKPEDIASKKSKELKLLYHHWFPNEKSSVLLLDLQKPVPTELTDIKYIQPIISMYNPYLTYFIKDLLSLLEPQLPKANIERICKLAKLLSVPDHYPAISNRVYTVEDVKPRPLIISEDDTGEHDSDCMEITEHSPEIICDNTFTTDTGSGIWQMASREYDWSTCPIGLLPWQQSK